MLDNINNILNNSLIYNNFTEILTALDETILLLLVSLPIGFILSLIFAIGRVSNNLLIASCSFFGWPKNEADVINTVKIVKKIKQV